MKNIVSKIFGKLTLGCLAIILQFSWLVYMLYGATAAYSVINLFYEILAVILSLHIASKDMRTSFKMSWIFLILLLPVFGITAYYLFGRSEVTRRTRKKMIGVSKKYLPLRSEAQEIKEELYSRDIYAGRQSDYITNYAGYPLYRENDSKYYGSMEELYETFLDDLRGARHFIFMEYFIIASGRMLDGILDILEQKAAEGVVVRIIYDDMGSIKTLPSGFGKLLKEKGISCACFNPFRPMLSVIMNNRDHRKITVIDGKTAYTGGFNLADEYINEVSRFGHWKDAGIRLTGDCVWSFTTMFMEMWEYITGEKEDCEIYHYKQETGFGQEHVGYVQPYSDSPMDREDVGMNVYLNMINHAKREITIFTPYLILGSEMVTTLVNAAKTGVDVKIVVPGIPDKKIIYLLTKANFAPLLRGGVKIFLYTPGFIHSKCFVVDDDMAAVGTINLDYRSLYLHFECGVFMYKTKAVKEVKQDVEETLKVCRPVDIEETKEGVFVVRMLQGVLKLSAPLL